MKGDYYRYLAEFKKGPIKREAVDHAFYSYRRAEDLAKSSLDSTHPVRLGLALNFSVFYYEIMSSPDRACSLAKQAFDKAYTTLRNTPEKNYINSEELMQILGDNLTLWITEV